MIDFTDSLPISTSQGQLLQLPPPRTRLLALPAPDPKITGFLADGLPVIEIPESIPPLAARSAPSGKALLEAYLKEKTGFRNADEINAYFDARLEAKKKQDYERLMQHPAFRRWADRRVS